LQILDDTNPIERLAAFNWKLKKENPSKYQEPTKEEIRAVSETEFTPREKWMMFSHGDFFRKSRHKAKRDREH
jgi:hypothetical protein